jgi:hypothetical protein
VSNHNSTTLLHYSTTLPHYSTLLCVVLYRYFPDLASVVTHTLCVDANIPEVVSSLVDMCSSDITIIGGGGLLDHSDRWNYALKYYCELTTCKWCSDVV